jgi:hypothetical protein
MYSTGIRILRDKGYHSRLSSFACSIRLAVRIAGEVVRNQPDLPPLCAPHY